MKAVYRATLWSVVLAAVALFARVSAGAPKLLEERRVEDEQVQRARAAQWTRRIHPPKVKVIARPPLAHVKEFTFRARPPTDVVPPRVREGALVERARNALARDSWLSPEADVVKVEPGPDRNWIVVKERSTGETVELPALVRPGKTSAHMRVIRELAEYARDSPDDDTDRHLARLAFTSPTHDRTWRQRPAVFKMYSAYASADAAEPGGGQKFLAMLARSMAQTYPASTHSPVIRDYLDANPVEEGHRPRYAEPAVTKMAQSRTVVPAADRAMIVAIADHLANGPLGSTHQILTTFFNQPPDRAFDLLLASTSDAEAMEHAAARLDARARYNALKTMSERIASKYPFAREEVLRHLSSLRGEPAAGAGPPPSPPLHEAPAP